MENPAATIHCSNIRCQAPNPQSNKFCQQCRTPLLRRYLWALGQEIEAYTSGEVLAGRYLLVRQRILLDTKPGTPPEMPQDIPQGIAPYLRLSLYGLHIPQVYGQLTPMERRGSPEIWLLEEAPINTGSLQGGGEAADTQGQLLPELTSVWKDAPPMRQLNWLWQLANLWQPLSSEGVASSLLTPALLRVEGPIVRLLELQPDTKGAPILKQLGQLWLQQLLPGASSVIAGFFQQLCTQLTEGQIRTSEELVALLDRALKDSGRSLSRTYQIFTRSESGPSRPHNEDACYPSPGQLIRLSAGDGALAIVCDGIGGHEGGEVASQLAIETLRERVAKLPADPNNWNPATLSVELERAACAANDSISEQNDNEQRSDRQRMGTTLVMARTSAHEMYITHVGDSRVYWVTRHNCHQVTQDEDCVFLLCSDGLSDNDRVEQHWQTEILPILDGRIDLPTAGARLIEIANTQNGHDNATVALVHCKVTTSKQTRQRVLSAPQLESLPTTSMVPTVIAGAASSGMKTQQMPSPVSAGRPWGLLLGIFVLLGLGGVLAYVFLPRSWVAPLISRVSNQGEEPEATSSAPQPASPSPVASPTSSPEGVYPLEVGRLIQAIASNPKNSEGQAIRLVLRRGFTPQNNEILGFIPAGSVLQVINELPAQQWLQLRVCSPGTGNSQAQQSAPPKPSPGRTQSQIQKSPAPSQSRPTVVSYPPVGQGVSGWIRKGDIELNINPNFTPTPAQQSECAALTPSPVSTPTPNVPQSP